MVRKVAIAGMLATAVLLSACNTMRGAKEDVNSASKAVEKSTDGK
jgi:predicted small secreted protein